jgi:hypothetical protein
LQRTTSALTAAVLGAVLTASTALAQQAPAPDDAPPVRGSSTRTKAGPGSAAEAANSQLYGMSVTRGARYLLRNGLDYLSYQQYDRALKFLREAEARVTDQKTRKVQMELNDAEVTALKQGIEAAQRGLRRASNAESPYALSDKSRPGNGFTPAKPSSLIAARGNQSNALSRKAKAARDASPSVVASDGDDDQGQPVRLASGEMPVTSQPAVSGPIARSASNNNSSAPDSTVADGPTNMPETPQIPVVSRLPDLTQVNGSEQLVAADDQRTAKDPVSSLPPLVPPDSAPPVSNRAPNVTVPDVEVRTARSPQPIEPKLATPASGPPTTAEPSSLLTQTLETSPAVVPAAEAPANSRDQDQAPGLPISDGTTAAPGVVATPPAPPAQAIKDAPTDGLATPAAANAVTESTPKSPVIALETIPSSAPVENKSQPAMSDGPSHHEGTDAVPAPGSTTTPVAPASLPNAAPEPAVASTGAGEDLPPLPAELGRSAPNVSVTVAPKAQPAPTEVPPPGPPADDVLPPLPAETDRSAPAHAESAPSPAETVSTPAPGPGPTTTIPAEQPAQPDQVSAAQPADEPLPVLPAGIDAERAAATVRKGTTGTTAPESPVMASPVTVPPAGPSNPVTVPDSTTEHPQQPSLNASPAPTAPGNPPDPTANPNLEAQPTTTTATGVEAQPDVSTLPPALTGGRTLASSTDAFIPDRANPPSTLKPELQREVERIARRQEEEMHRQAQNPTQPANAPRDTMASDLRTQTQMDISRAPSPAEARPIKAIPVPEDWVPLAPRNWAPQRKYWAAAATCHLPLYFQDPVLERYGHSVEQFVGPLGRFLSYPVDDPTQSTQRNQMLQPFFSAGLMGLQIIAWPYNLIMDPPWEAQYDLGYYRPGDSIPTDTYWLPLHGYGPPLRGNSY